jgi:hypothetical protein
MAKAIDEVMLRIRCCRCGRIDRYVAAASAAFSVADQLLSVPCAGSASRARPCNSRDRRLDLRAAVPSQVHGAGHLPG